MATWKAAGYDAATIALLAGHSSKVTAAKHYAGKSKGWKADFAVALPGEAPAPAADEAAVPTTLEDLVEATPAIAADAPDTADPDAASEPTEEAEEKAGEVTPWDSLLEFASLRVPSRKPAGNTWRDRTRSVAREHPPAPDPALAPVDIPTHPDPGEPDLVEESEEDVGLGMRF